MKLATAYARFYKSFNFDQARKLHKGSIRQPWETFRDLYYPYVSVPMDPRITTVVGANESGKSHLLGVIKKAITGEDMEQRDVCRYSAAFGVAQGQLTWPHVGVGWDGITAAEAAPIAEVLEISNSRFDRLLMFREQPDRLTVWHPEGGTFVPKALTAEETLALEALLPRPFEIDAGVALPNSIPFSFLADGDATLASTLSRSGIDKLVSALSGIAGILKSGAIGVQNNAQLVTDALAEHALPIANQLSETEIKSLDLGRKLLLTIGDIDPRGLSEIAKGIDEQHNGYAAGLLDKINEQLSRRLNFRKYWVQDRDFNLKVVTRDRELVFLINDRTGTTYEFSERSSGLRYFLSYLIQAQVHRPASARESILLMDEPDTFLSAEAQQDLMRVFRDLAEPGPGRDPLQVVYVTHSPFLLDKNHAERIRVLEKGTGFEGTRVVPNASRNHYEPLRSAFGPLVGESAFVGSVNLIVEGAADQILLAGTANLTRQRSPGIMDDTLDLNRLTIVLGGSASELAFSVYRVRGQGADKPPVVVLLDGDTPGLTAKRQFSEDKQLRRLIKPESVLDLAQIGVGIEGWPTVPEIEDLVPVALAHRAVELVIKDVVKFREGDPPTIALADIEAEHARGGPVMDAINRVVGSANGRIDKIAFAKSVIAACRENDAALRDSVDEFLDRMTIVFRAVNAAIRRSTADNAHKRLEALVSERTSLFAIDHPDRASREQARIVLGEVETQLDDSPEAEAIRNAIVPLIRDFALRADPAEDVPDYSAFLEALQGLRFAWRIVESGMNDGQTLENRPATKSSGHDRRSAGQATKERATRRLKAKPEGGDVPIPPVQKSRSRPARSKSP